MTTTDTDALKERIARDLWDHDNLHMSAAWRDMAWDDMGGSEPSDERIAYMLRAAAVLPIVEAEVRKAKAEAWDEGCEAFESAHKCDHIEPWGHLRDNPYRETGASDDHR